MKNTFILIALFSLMISSCSQNNNIQEISRIYDNEDILTDHQEQYLNGVIAEFHRKTSNQIIVLTAKDLNIYETASQYALIFGNEHSIFKAGENKGLVIFVSKNMQITALTTGNEPDRSLKDEISKHIVNSCMVPLFSKEKYYEGIKVAIKESIKNWN